MTFDLSLDCGKLVRFQEVGMGRKAEGETVCRGPRRWKRVFKELRRNGVGLSDIVGGQLIRIDL